METKHSHSSKSWRRLFGFEFFLTSISLQFDFKRCKFHHVTLTFPPSPPKLFSSKLVNSKFRLLIKISQHHFITIIYPFSYSQLNNYEFIIKPCSGTHYISMQYNYVFVNFQMLLSLVSLSSFSGVQVLLLGQSCRRLRGIRKASVGPVSHVSWHPNHNLLLRLAWRLVIWN